VRRLGALTRHFPRGRRARRRALPRWRGALSVDTISLEITSRWRGVLSVDTIPQAADQILTLLLRSCNTCVLELLGRLLPWQPLPFGHRLALERLGQHACAQVKVRRTVLGIGADALLVFKEGATVASDVASGGRVPPRPATEVGAGRRGAARESEEDGGSAAWRRWRPHRRWRGRWRGR
jgi:hypothetical protein